MDSEVTTCIICCETFNDGIRKPLLLPCNHTFCQKCLLFLENIANKECALCKKRWDQKSVSDLSILYQLIPCESSPQKSSYHENCGPHREKATFWCESCIVPICNSCLDEEHKHCNFMVFHKYQGREDYENALKDFLKNVAQNDDRVDIFESFELEIKNHRGKYSMWNKNSQKIHDQFQKKCAEQLGGQANSKLHSNRKEAKEGYEKLNNDVPSDTLLFHMAKAYQETTDLTIDTFIGNLRQSAGMAPEGRLSSTSGTSEVNTSSYFKDGHVWTVRDTTAGNKATEVLCSTTARPSQLVVTGVHWTPNEISSLLRKISAVNCTVRVQFLDIFWTPGKESVENTQLRLDTLLKPEHKCILTQFWGHIDVEGIKKLPDTIQSVGLVIKTSEDLKATKTLLRVAFERPFFAAAKKKWIIFSELNLCFFKALRDESGLFTGQWNSDACKLMATCSTLNVKFGLHFSCVNLNDMLWVQSVIIEVTPEPSQRRQVKDIYFPGTSLDANKLLEFLMDLELQCRVHLPCHQLNDSDAVKSYSAIGCSVTWDLESITYSSQGCVLM